ncbi:hypothetical protein ACFWPU_00890 [Streptomyces sp. NPDC058471]|uniref:hypothetical protein n=1 Tax=Streptomyces sp. NPDC058471 TaxID=3346516 RepID=UPI0036682D16
MAAIEVITQGDYTPAKHWTAVYWRYYSKCTETFDSWDEAASFLDNGENEGTMSSEDILRPDGTSTGWDWITYLHGDDGREIYRQKAIGGTQ